MTLLLISRPGDLKECPLCHSGDSVHIFNQPSMLTVEVHCSMCQLTLSQYSGNLGVKHAIERLKERWNTRTKPDISRKSIPRGRPCKDEIRDHCEMHPNPGDEELFRLPQDADP